jgi:hypothetical protein
VTLAGGARPGPGVQLTVSRRVRLPISPLLSFIMLSVTSISRRPRLSEMSV